MAKKRERSELIGLDLVDMTPDYTKSFEENKAIWAERYKKAYGEWPPWMPNGPKREKPDDVSGT